MLDLPYAALHWICPTPVTYPMPPYADNLPTLTTYPTPSSLSVCELPLAATPSAPLPNLQVHERFLFRMVPHMHRQLPKPEEGSSCPVVNAKLEKLTPSQLSSMQLDDMFHTFQNSPVSFICIAAQYVLIVRRYVILQPIFWNFFKSQKWLGNPCYTAFSCQHHLKSLCS